jgi:hypothetical protein
LVYKADFGREIKNTLRSAQALAEEDGTALTMDHINIVLAMQKKFKVKIDGDPGTFYGMGIS